MSEPFIGQIIQFAGNFEIRGWAFCNGQLLSIAQNTALFSLLGTTYGGNGTTTFGLPDLRGRVAIHPGQGPGLSNYVQGQMSGSETNTLTVNQLPMHNHPVHLRANSGPGETQNPSGAYPAESDSDIYAASADANGPLVNSGNTGGNQPVNNIQPYNTVQFLIALQGIFPSRN